MSVVPGSLRFNHVALTVPRDQLDESGRKALVDFYGEVFGWREFSMLTEDRGRLVFQCFSVEEFLYINGADEETMRAGKLDHFGISVPSKEQFEETREKARRFREKDPRVEIRENDVESHYEALELHSFYVRHLLPMWVEVQYFDWKIDPRGR